MQELAEPLHYDAENGKYCIVVPKGFKTKMRVASVPPPFDRLLPPDGRYRDAAWIHDFLFSKQGFYYAVIGQRRKRIYVYSRKFANQVMYDVMDDPELRVKGWRKWMIRKGLQLGSWFAWDR
jgi:hypothetical protein